MCQESSNVKYKHQVKIGSKFRKKARKLDKNIKEVLFKKLRDVANDPENAGKRLKYPYENKYSVRVTRRFRLIYSIPKYCQVKLENLQHRDVVYKNL